MVSYTGFCSSLFSVLCILCGISLFANTFLKISMNTSQTNTDMEHREYPRLIFSILPQYKVINYSFHIGPNKPACTEQQCYKRESRVLLPIEPVPTRSRLRDFHQIFGSRVGKAFLDWGDSYSFWIWDWVGSRADWLKIFNLIGLGLEFGTTNQTSSASGKVGLSSL